MGGGRGWGVTAFGDVPAHVRPRDHTSHTHSTGKHTAHAALTVQKNCAGVPPGGLPMSAVLWCSMCCRGTRPWTAVFTRHSLLVEWRHTKLNCARTKAEQIYSIETGFLLVLAAAGKNNTIWFVILFVMVKSGL